MKLLVSARSRAVHEWVASDLESDRAEQDEAAERYGHSRDDEPNYQAAGLIRGKCPSRHRSADGEDACRHEHEGARRMVVVHDETHVPGLPRNAQGQGLRP
jgi:hypothetical protein